MAESNQFAEKLATLVLKKDKTDSVSTLCYVSVSTVSVHCHCIDSISALCHCTDSVITLSVY